MKSLDKISNKIILIDTNIFIYYSIKDFAKRANDILEVLSKNKNELFVSKISGLELLRGGTGGVSNNSKKTPAELDVIREKYAESLNSIPNIDVTHAVLNNACILADEYKRHNRNAEIPLADLIIGSTAYTFSNTRKKVYVLTADKNDFCEPLWSTIAHYPIYTNGHGSQLEAVFYLMEINIELILYKKIKD